MKLNITGRHIEITKAFNQYVRKRFKKWSTFLGPEALVHVILSVEGYRHQVEVTAKDGPYLANGKQITKDMYQSVDLLAEKIGRQLMRQHERLTTTKNQRPRGRKPPLPVKVKDTPDRPLEIEEEPLGGKPMTAEEAALQLQTLRSDYLVFEDIETGQLAVIQKSRSGRFKLITKD